MTRSVLEWIGPHDDARIPPRVRLRVLDRQDGRCAECARKLGVAGERIEIDHVRALVNGGEHRESNLQALCAPCHGAKTRADVAEKAATNRKRSKALGLTRAKRKMPYRKFNGEIVWPE